MTKTSFNKLNIVCMAKMLKDVIGYLAYTIPELIGLMKAAGGFENLEYCWL
jgi:hypothetical protein